MPDSTGETPDPKPTDASAKPAPETPVLPSPKLARANRSGASNPKGAAPAGAPPGATEFMEWMKALSGGPVEEEPAPGRTLIPKEQKKFSRRTPETAKTASPAAASGPVGEVDAAQRTDDPAAEDETGEPTPTGRPAPRDLPLTERKRRAPGQAIRSPGAVLFTQFLVFALIVGSFFLGRVTVSRQTVAPAAPARVSAEGEKGPVILPPELMAKVDQANAAESAGDFKHARALLEEVRQAGGRIVGLDFHLAELAYADHDWPAVLPLLNDSIAKGEKVADSYNLRGTLTGQRGGQAKGIADLQRASQLDPFDAKFAFFVGESLRRQGKPQAAQAYLRRALDRLSDPSQEEFYRLKLRLAQIESGQEKQFADELAAKLALNPPPMDWLFTAAAEELHRDNVSAAAGYLAKAQALYKPAEMNTRLRDYYFYSFSDNKDLAPFFESILHPAPTPAPSAAPTPSVAPTVPALETSAPDHLPKAP